MNFKQKKIFKFGAIIVALNMIINISLPGVFAFANTSGIELNITSNKQKIEGGDRVEFTLDYQIKGGPGTIKEGEEIRFTLPDDFKDLVPVCPSEHFKSVKKEGNTVIATFGKGVEDAIGGYVAVKATVGNVDSPKREKVTVELNGIVKNLDITIEPNPDDKPDPPHPPKPIDRELFKTIDGYSWLEDGKMQTVVNNPAVGKTVKYDIYVNEKFAHLNNALLSDRIPDGMNLLEDSVSIQEIKTDGTIKDVTDEMKSMISKSSDYLKVQFVNISSKYIVKYTTKINMQKAQYENTANLQTEEGKLESSTIAKTRDDKTMLTKTSFTKDQATDENGKKQNIVSGVGDEVTYRIDVNQNNAKMSDAILEDVTPNGMELIADSIDIWEKNADGSLNNVTDSFKDKIKIENGKITIEFGNTNKGYIIGYKLKVTSRQREYNNKAKLDYNKTSQEANSDVKYEMNAGAINAHKSVDKTEIKDGDNNIVNYSIDFDVYGYFNANYLNITDKLDKNVKILDVQVPKEFTATIDKNTNEIKVVNDKGGIEYGKKLKVLIKTDFTNVPDGSSIRNTAKINKSTTNEVITKKGYSFSFYKIDSKDSSKKLEGAKFTLMDNNHKVISTLTSDKNGLVTSALSKTGDYYIKEVQAPNGYVLNSNEVKFTVKDSDIGNVIKLQDMKNDLDVGSVVLTKVDSDNGKTLSGAIFKVVDSNNKIVAENLTTDKEGKITVDNLKPGKYSFIETKAPEGYKLNSNPIAFEIVMSQKDVAKVTAKNEIIPGSVILTKVDSDNGKTLSGAIFKVVDSNNKIVAENLTTDKDGKITVDNLKPGKYSFIETKAPEGYKLNSNPIAFEIVMSQKDVAKVTAKNEIIPGSVVLTKVDSDNGKTLSGAIFKVVDSNNKIVAENLTTDKDGKITVDNLKPGKYSFIETKAPEGYKLNSNPIAFEIVMSQKDVAKVTAKNELIPGSVILTKVDSDNGKTLSGAIFKVVDSNNKIVAENLTTDKEGKITVDNLKPGKYSFIETKAPEGYKLNSNPIAFEIVMSQKDVAKVTAKNELIPGSVILTKVDSDNGKTLSGAIFKVVDSNNKIVAENLTTDKEGKITVDNLKPGKYSFIETKAPEGYKLNSNPIAFEIVMSQKDVAKVTAKNELIPGSVILTKVDSDNGKTLSGAIFKVVDSNNKTVAENLTTDKEGKITVDNLKPGKYSFIETKAPEGYKLNSNPIAFEIVMSQKDVAKVTAKNELIPGSVILTKVDSDNGKTLSGAIFKVVDSNNKIVAENLTTDKEGKITVDNLKPGKYSFIETKAPEGYKLNSNPIAFEIVMSQKDVAKVTAKNELIPGSVILTKVDSDNGKTLSGAIFKVVDSNNKTVAENLTTDKEGKITVDNLKPGKYSFIETKAPEGYKLNSNPIAFEIVMSQKDVAKVTAKNELEKVPTDPEEPKEPAKPVDPTVPKKNKIKETIDNVIKTMNPKTGDPGVLGYVAVMAIAGIGLVSTKKKK